MNSQDRRKFRPDIDRALDARGVKATSNLAPSASAVAPETEAIPTAKLINFYKALGGGIFALFVTLFVAYITILLGFTDPTATLIARVILAFAWLLSVLSTFRLVSNLERKSVRGVLCTAIALVIATGFVRFDQWLTGTRGKPSTQSASRADTDAIMGLLRRITNSEIGGDTVTESVPGSTQVAFLRFVPMNVNRRQYIFDFGSLTVNRRSVYLSASNILTFAILDSNGEEFTVRAPMSTFKLGDGEVHALVCELGEGNGGSFLIMSIDGTQVGRTNLPLGLTIEKLNIHGGVMGSDLTKSLGGSFDGFGFFIYDKTLNFSGLQSLASNLAERVKDPRYYMFRGSQWAQVNARDSDATVGSANMWSKWNN